MSCCTGKCCAVFNFPTDIPTLEERGDDESKFLADMLIELTPEQAMERVERFDITSPIGWTAEQWAHESGKLYTCRHWNEETRLCGVYEQRPRMCRDYPYNGRCNHDCKCEYLAPADIRELYPPNGSYALEVTETEPAESAVPTPGSSTE